MSLRSASPSGQPRGIPIGTAFLSGAAGIYHNDQKADMYDRASRYVKKLINMSDLRIANGSATVDAKEAGPGLRLRLDAEPRPALSDFSPSTGHKMLQRDPNRVERKLKFLPDFVGGLGLW